MALQLGGTVARTGQGEYGRTELSPGVRRRRCAPTGRRRSTVWMSHGDAITAVPAGFVATATTPGAPVAAMHDPERRLFGLQFHPEVVHTDRGSEVFDHFLIDVCGCLPGWTHVSIIEQQVAAVRAQVGSDRVLCALSGGVDSAVAAALVHKAVGDQLTCVFVDTGLMRAGEADQVEDTFRRQFKVDLVHVKAADRYFAALAGVTDPERKRKIIGELFIRIFEEVARDLGAGGRCGRAPERRGHGDGPALPGPGDALPRRDRVGQRHRGQHQVAPQRGRAARGPRLRAGRAAAPALQGRGARGRARSSACPTRSCGASPSPVRAWACASSAR